MSSLNIWALADLHLPFGAPDKSMEVFGPQWAHYTERIQDNWRSCVTEKDWVVIAGDISWAMTLEQAKKDLEWIDQLPGKKVLIKGNHDYWWSSIKKVRQALPPSLYALQNDSLTVDDLSFAGSRLWDTAEIDCSSLFAKSERSLTEEQKQKNEKIFSRELDRLETSLKTITSQSTLRIALTHYPPIGPEGNKTSASKLLSDYNVDISIFGHLHALNKKQSPHWGCFHNVDYFITSADLLQFQPLHIRSV